VKATFAREGDVLTTSMPDEKRVRPLNEVEPELLRQTTDEITALIAERLPLMFPADDDWPPIAHGFLAREPVAADA
jgi:hypothetical protein